MASPNGARFIGRHFTTEERVIIPREG